MPQWDFLNFLAEEAARYSTFQLRRQADVTGLIEEAGSVVGIRANTPDGPLEVRASLVVGADGRHSVVRAKAGFSIEEFGAPMDVLWFRLSRRPSDPGDPIGRFDAGRIFIMLNRGDYWQCGFVIAKGSRDQLAPVVSSWSPLYRRCGACHVAGRWRRNQPGHPGCGCDGESAGCAATCETTDNQGSPAGPAAA